MARLEKMRREFREGDPWPPDEMNRLALHSGTYQARVEREHADDCTHDTPLVARAGGFIRWTGVDYDHARTAGIAKAESAGGGLVVVSLEENRPLARWAVLLWPEGQSEGGGDLVPVELEGKDEERVEIRLPAGTDGSFTLYVLDIR